MHYWSEDEVRAYLPRLNEILSVLREAAELPNLVKSNGHASITQGHKPHSAKLASGEADFNPQISIGEAIQELDEYDVIVRDPKVGIVDFWARGEDGVDYLLCWRSGEEDLGWWHFPDEGFMGRKRLPRISKP